MTVLTTIPNGANYKDIRDTINALITDVGVLKGSGGVTPTPTPTPTLSFSAAAETVLEGDTGTKTVANTLNVVRNGAAGALVVNLATSGTATAGVDYVALPSTVTIPDGSNSVTYNLTINGDTGVEPDETVIQSAALAAYPSATASRTVTIGNDDVAGPVTGDPMSFVVRNATPFDMQYVNGTDGTQAGVDGNGWVGELVFKGMAANQTFDATKVTITVQDPGFDNTGATVTRTRTIKGGLVLRRQFPNAATKAIDAQGSDVVVQFSLSETIYAGSTIQSVTVAAGAYGSSNAKTLSTATNNSTRAYEKPLFAWLSMPLERVGAATMKVEASAFSKMARLGQQVACIQYSATDGTNTSPVVTSGAATLSTLVTKGQVPECYPATLNLTNLNANGAACTVNARVLPWIGNEAAVLDLSRDGAAFNKDKRDNWFPLPFTCDRTGVWGGAYAYVKAGATGGAANIDPAVARTTPFPHIAKALAGLSTYNNTRSGRTTTGGSTIRFMDDGAGGEAIHSFGGDQTSVQPGTCWVELSRDPAATGSVAITGNNNDYEQYYSMFKFKDIKLYGGTPGGLNGLYLARENTAGGINALDNVEMHAPGLFNVVYGAWLSARNVEFRNRSGTTVGSHGNQLAGSLQCLGVVAIDDTNARLGAAALIGCKLTVASNSGWGGGQDAGWDGFVVANNYFNCGTTWWNSNVAWVRGSAFVQNVIDNMLANANSQLIQVLADGASGSINNFIEMHNTVAGERGNFLYCDVDSTVGSLKRGCRMHSIWHNWNNKRDTFNKDASAEAESRLRGRTGNWEWAWAVNSRGMVSIYGSKSGAGPGASSYMGDHWLPDSLPNAGAAVTFTDARFTSSGGTWGGNYHLTGAGNAAYGRVAAGMAVLARDFDGAARRNDGTGAAGAYERTQ